MHSDLDGLGPRFRLDVFVARGAWGSVYRGVDLDTGAEVAVKRLHRHLCEPTMIARFEREASLLARIESPHVVRHAGHGRDGEGRPYLALEWLDGEDLARWRKTRRFGRREAIEVARQAALGLAALHEAGIVHRDVKPSNFFRRETPEGSRVKLIDLGIARASGEATLTATGFTLGTPAYMSPEQARGEPRPTPASDLFSLGVLLFELLAGQKPYRADDMVSLATKIVLQDPPRLRDLAPGAPAALDEILGRAMRKAPEDRFPSASSFAEALGALEIADEPAPPALESDARPSRLVLSEGGSPGGSPATWTLAQAGEPPGITALFARFDGTDEPSAAIEGFREVAERLGGVFHRVLGPQRAAVFGAGRGDEALRAARAALALAAIAGVRVSIVSGRAAAGAGSLSAVIIDRGLAELRRCRSAELRVDETTARLLEGRFGVDGPRGDRSLRAVAPPPDALGPTLLGKPALFVGRDREAAGLYAVFDECVSEPVARAILITGPAGAGKSRLIHELVRRAEAGPAPPLVLRAHPPEGTALDDARRAAWEDWIAAEHAARPVVLVLDDLHGRDLPSVSLVDAALRRARAAPLLVLAAARAEVHQRFPALFAGLGLEEVRLAALSRKAAEKLVRRALGPDADAAVVRRVIDGAEGNPGRLEALVRAVGHDGGP